MFRFILVLAILAMPVASFAELESIISQDFNLANLGQYKRALALDMAKHLNDVKWAELSGGKLSSRNSSVELVPLLKELNALVPSRENETWTDAVAQLDKKIRETKGIAEKVANLLEIRLAFPEKGFSQKGEILVSYIPTGNERSWKFIEAFDTLGNAYKLDVYQAPQKQILVVGLDARKDMKAGIELMNEELCKAGMQTTVPQRAGIDVAKLNYIRLADDKEPWISGDAEIYTMVNGIAPEAEKANIIAMEMPYLANDKTDYYPNQVLIIWQNYRYKAANLNVYEHDDSTNYKEIVATLIEKIGQIVPEYQFIADIASQIIRLMPDSWFTNDDDYVDVYYTLENKAYTNFMGVSNNAKITLVPYFIPE